ncbi:putative inactive poly [ADP-ribose] polymerase SRO1 isoform X2 [Curcuma longa]|uniref:putative inactive poly [ADP-ribose] polymerase SRO1 isoform X2 n=1 Tax=Curcuma longa TaxID=136217 RepID=UPI003D9E74EB
MNHRPTSRFSDDRRCIATPWSMAMLNGAGSGNLSREFHDFKKSAAPMRILFYRDGAWTDFSPAATVALRARFVAGKTSFKLPIAGSCYLFDFRSMSQIDTETNVANSIAWVDAHGRCVFPTSAIENQSLPPPIPLRESPAESADCDSEGSTATSLGGARWNGAEACSEGDKYFTPVASWFLKGYRRYAPTVVITAIHRCTISASRSKAFQLQEQMTKAARGDANIKASWYGASAEEVAAVVSHGFGKPANARPGSPVGGFGLHLSALPFSHSSAVEANSGDGERHMLLCRVILGRPEKVETASEQHHPSSDEFDSGVDDTANPKHYVVWSTHMNTHIIPDFIVSYKIPHRPRPAANSAPRLMFPHLLAEMRRILPSWMMRIAEDFYKQLQKD